MGAMDGTGLAMYPLPVRHWEYRPTNLFLYVCLYCTGETYHTKVFIIMYICICGSIMHIDELF